MKTLILRNHFYITLFFLSLFQLTINESGLYLKSLDLSYSHWISLLNGNIFILHSKGVIVYNYNFTIILYQYNFGGSTLISSDKEDNLTTIIQCDDNADKYIIALICNNIYVFSYRGQYLFKILDTNIFSSLPSLVYYNSYSFLYYKNEGNIYYFLLVYKDSNELVQFNQLKLNIDAKTYEIFIKIPFEEEIYSDNFSCQLTNILICFYAKLEENKIHFLASSFNQENQFEKLNTIEIAVDYLAIKSI